MEMVHDIFFLDSLTINIREKCLTNIINVFDIISKKFETWELNHSCKDPNHSFFDFVLIFWERCTWNWGMIYIFLTSLTLNIWKKCVTNIIIMLGNILKKCSTWALKHSCKGPNHSFFDFVIIFWGGCEWKWCMIYFFLDSLMFNLWKTCVTDIIKLLGIVLKKWRTWVLA